MVDRTKIGARVPEPVYNDFKNMVQSVHGQTRGVLGDEIGNALRAYMEGDFEGSAESDVSNEDLLREIRELKTGESPASPRPGSSESEGTHTHTAGDGSKSEPTVSDGGASGDVPEPSESEGSANVPNSSPDKPGEHSSQAAKIRWLANRCDLDGSAEFEEMIKFVRGHYPYRSDTVEQLAWGVAGMLAPEESMLDDDVNPPSDEHRHFSGAWFVETEYEDGASDTNVFLGESGGTAWSVAVKSRRGSSTGTGSGSSTGSESKDESTDGESEEESTDSGSEEGDIAGAEEGDSTFDEMADADRGRDY